MARSFSGSVANYLINASAPVTAYPLTMSSWFKTAATGAQGILHLDSLTTSNEFSIGIRPTSVFSAIVTQAGSQQNADATASATANVWHHGCGVFTNATLRTSYLDGANAGTNVVSSTPTGINNTTIGAWDFDNLGPATPFNGSIGETAIWNVALTAGEVAALAKGVRAYLIRPSALVAYWPLNGLSSPEPDLSGNAQNLTITGSVPAANNPPITLWTPKSITNPYSFIAPVGGAYNDPLWFGMEN